MMAVETQVENEDTREAKTVEGTYDRIKSVEDAHKALLSRKRHPLWLQIYLCFLIIFIFTAGVGVIIVKANLRVEKKLRFLEIVNDITREIAQARRFEENFFLYGTSLGDAIENSYHAQEILKRNEGELKKILGDTHGVILSNINQYLKLLERLIGIQENETFSPDQVKVKKEIELALKKHGRELVFIIRDLKERERKAVSDILSRSRFIQIYYLIFFLILLQKIDTLKFIRYVTIKMVEPVRTAGFRLTANSLRPVSRCHSTHARQHRRHPQQHPPRP